MRRTLFLVLALLGPPGCSRRDPPEPPPAPPQPLEVAQKQLLTESLQECFAGNCEGPQRRVAELPPDSALRNSPEARAIEYRRLAEEMLASDMEQDLKKRKTTLLAIQQSTAADQVLRAAATQRLMAIASAAPTTFAVVFAGDAGTAARQPSSPTTSLPEPPNPFALAKGGKKGLVKARAILEPKVVAGRATLEETRLLFSVCKQLKDRKCETEAHANMR